MKQKQLLNRKTYKEVKKMDRQEMEEFITKIYHQGFQDGAKAGSLVDFQVKLAEVLKNTKGVGPKLFEKIMFTAKEMEKKD